MHHQDWHPSHRGPFSQQADSFINWTQSTGLTFISNIDVPTHNRGNFLDICFASSLLKAEGTSAAVQRDLDVTSDHSPLLITVPFRNRTLPLTQRLRFATINQDFFLSLPLSRLEGLPPFTNTSKVCIDERAEELIKVLQNAYEGSAKGKMPLNRGQPWWDLSCNEAREKYRSIARSGTVTLTDRKEYRKVIYAAKSNFFQQKLESVSNSKELFDITKWHKSKGAYRTPLVDPTSPGSLPAETLEDKRDFLARNLLSNQSTTVDIPLSTPTVALASLPFPAITPKGVSEAILNAGNTTPGKDKIPTVDLRLAWPLITSIVRESFQACVDQGYHPRCFRTAISAIIRKPNKADMTSPRSYRPITLLSVLGKGLERLIARRMS